MELALRFAEKGKGKTSPNPMVGCIIVKRNSIVGRGYHKKAGDIHAEIHALNEAGKKAKNATMYVTLEPCSHWGKTPPCTEMIVEAGISEVIVSTLDANPLVSGYRELKFRGIKTKLGILEVESRRLNEVYFKYIKSWLPFVTVKAAISLDGKIATTTGSSKYITGRAARKYVHQLRSEYDAVMVGVNTVIMDDPELNVRYVKGRDPIKIVVDSNLKIPLKSRVFLDPTKLIIATTKRSPKKKIREIQQRGANVLVIESERGQVNLKKLMKELIKHEITSVMIEGGAELNSNSIKAEIVDKVMFFIAPGIIGAGLNAIGDLGIRTVDKSIKLKNISSKRIGKDILVEGYL